VHVVDCSVRELVLDPPEVVQTGATSRRLSGPYRGCGPCRLGGDADVDGAAGSCTGLEIVISEGTRSRKEGTGFAGNGIVNLFFDVLKHIHLLNLHVGSVGIDAFG
jgi:hypothetical protein